MIFDKLQLLNFRHHVETDVQFGRGLTAIVGENGTGKTTLLEGIAWGLYGASAALGPQSDIPFDRAEGKTRVVLKFEVAGSWYRIAREPGSATLFRYGDPGQDPVAICEGSRACAEFVATEIFGMDWHEWSNTFFAMQKGLDWLKGRGPTDRERFLSETLGYGRVRAAQVIARTEKNTTKGRLDVLEGQLAGVEDVDGRIEETTKEVEDAKTRVGVQRGLVERTTRLRDEAKAAVNADYETARAWSAANEAVGTAATARKDAQIDIDRLEATLLATRELAANVPGKVEMVDGITASLSAAAHEREIRDKWLESRRAEVRAEGEALAGLKADVEGAKAKMEMAQTDVAELQGFAATGVATCPKCRKPISDEDFERLLSEAAETADAHEAEYRRRLEEWEAEDKAWQARRQEVLDDEKSVADEFAWTAESEKLVHSYNREIAAAQEQIEKSAEAEERVVALRESLPDLEKAEAEAREHLASIEYDASAADDRRMELDDLQTSLHGAERELHRAEQTLTTSETRLEALKAEKRRESELRDEVKDSRSRLIVVEATDRMFGDLRRHLTQRIRPELSDRATTLVAEMTNGRFSSLHLDETYMPVLMSHGRRIPLASGGEWDVANLALRLATSQLIAERSGHALDVAILDEPLGMLSYNRRLSVAEALHSIGDSKFEQLIIVTHQPEIRDVADHVIECELDDRECARVTVHS